MFEVLVCFWLNFLQLEGTSYDVMKYSTPVTLLFLQIETWDFYFRGPGRFVILFLAAWRYVIWRHEIFNPCNFVIFADRNMRLLFLRSWYVFDWISCNLKVRHMTSWNIQPPVTLLFLQLETRDFYFWGPGMFLILFHETGSYVIWRHEIFNPM